jgi:PAS domain S-box-containing protein
LIAGVAFYVASISERSLEETIQASSSARATAVMDEIDRLMHGRIAEWAVYSHSSLVRSTLDTSHREFAKLVKVDQFIDARDATWRATPDGTTTPLMDRLLNEPLSEDLRVILHQLELENGFRVFGEVFITNRFGANVAQTNRTSDYRQNDEDWWRRAMDQGVYVGDVGFDESAGVFSTDLCIRIEDDQGAHLGVLKAVLNIEEVIGLLDERWRAEGGDGRNGLILFGSEKRIIHHAGHAGSFLQDGSGYFNGVSARSDGRAVVRRRTDEATGERFLVSYAYSRGHVGFAGLGWSLLSQYAAENVFTPARELRNAILLFALLASALVLSLTGAVAVSMSRRIAQLMRATMAIRRGDLSASVSLSGSDELAQLATSFNDMVAKISAEQQQVKMLTADLVEAHDQMTLILDSAGEGIYGLDLDGHTTFVNPATVQMIGWEAEELIGKSQHAILHHSRADGTPYPAEECPINAVLKDGVAHRIRNEVFWRKEGTSFPVEYISTPMQTPNGDVVGAVVTFRDLTEQRTLEAQLVQAQKLESIGQLAAGIAHEINTPAQYVGDNVEFLKQSFDELGELLKKYRALQAAAEAGDVSPELVSEVSAAAGAIDIEFLEEEIPRALAQSREGVDRVTKIVRAMKEFSHPGSEEKKPIDLNRAIQSTVTVARNEWKYVAELETDFDADLPPVPCLAGEFNQVVLNIVVNAAHALAEAHPENSAEKGKIRIQTRNEGEWAVIEISDNGTGIPEEIRSKIFDPFFTTKTVGKGSGQGLAIARSVVVDKHGGTIEVESALGEGTTFRIRLPLADPEAEAT